MKPMVMDTKKSDLLPISYICWTTAPLLPLAASDVVERADEDRVELARADEEVDGRGAQVVRRRPGGWEAVMPISCGCGLARRSWLAQPKEKADEVVEDEDACGAGDDRGVDGATDAGRAALGRRDRSGSWPAR